MRTYANTSEPIYDLPMSTNVNKPVYVNISRLTRDKPECRERLFENICSVSNCDTKLTESTLFTSSRTPYRSSYVSSLPPPPNDWLEALSSKDFDSVELNEVLTEGDRFLSMANHVAELSKETCSVSPYKKYRIAGSLCGVLGLGIAAGYFISRQFGGHSLKETQPNLSFPSLQPSTRLPLASTDMTTVISPYSLPDLTTGIVKTEPSYTRSVTTNSYGIKPSTEGNLVFEKRLYLPWHQQIKINSSSPLIMEVIDEMQLTLIETKNTFFDMFKLDDKVIDKFTNKKLVISLYTTTDDLLNTYNIKPTEDAVHAGKFMKESADNKERTIFVSTYDEKLYVNIAYEYARFLDAIFNGDPIILWDDKNQYQLYRWWSDGLANYISGGCEIRARNDKDLEYAIKEGDPYKDGAKIHGFLSSNEQLKGIRQRIVKGFQRGDKKDAKYIIEYLVRVYNQSYKEWNC